MRPLKVGVQLPEVERRVSWREMRRLAELAEQVGFDSLWLGDHLLYRLPGGVRGPWECWSMLAALAAVTSRVELGPLVASTSFHNPGVIAKKAAAVDEVSGGRLVLGLGAGWNRDEYEAFGFPYDRRVSRFEEAFTVIRILLSEGRIDFEGEFYRLMDCVLDPPPPRPGGPPLMVGSIGPRMLSITLPYVAAWNVWWDEFGNDPERFPPLVERVEEACGRVGRDPAEVEATACLLVQLGERPTRRVSENPVVGGPSAVADAVLRLHAAGAGHIQLVVDPITIESIEQLGEALDEIDAEQARR